MQTRFILAAVAVATIAFTAPAEARNQRHIVVHHTARHVSHHRQHLAKSQGWQPSAPFDQGAIPAYPTEQNLQNRIIASPMGKRHIAPTGVVYIPNPAGTWRIAQSCAHRLSAYWGLGKGLDKVSEWRRFFARVAGPGNGIAAVRSDNHHIMGIIGGGPGAWRVADFNSGRHLNREYTVSDFPGFYFLDTRTRIASR